MKALTRPSQKSMLAGVVRKRAATDNNEIPNDKSKESVPSKVNKTNDNNDEKDSANSLTGTSDANGTSNKIDLSVHDKGVLKCIGILPGIGKYEDSSDSEKSTDTDDEYDFSDFDWVGRKVKRNHDDCDD